LEERVAPSILETTYANLPYDTSNPDWASNVVNGRTIDSLGALIHGFPKWGWTPVYHPYNAYETNDLVGISGTAIDPNISSEDLEFTHPFGHDFEFDIAPDPQYNWLLSGHQRTLGVETDHELAPENYRPRDGDRVAIFGRWIVDAGHDDFHTEIHPPLLMASARNASADWTNSTVVGRPYLVSQEFLVGDHQDSRFLNRGDDDGAILQHGIREVGKTLGLYCPWYYFGVPCSARLEAHSGILAKPFSAIQTMDYILRPPSLRENPGDMLVTSFHFTVRSGVTVDFPQDLGPDAVHVRITMDANAYTQPPLPRRREVSFFQWQLLVAAGAWGLVSLPWNAPYAAVIAARGVLTDRYDAPRAESAFDYRQNAVDVDNTQPFPIYGYLNVGWQRDRSTHFRVDAPPEMVAGQAVPVTVRALDARNNPVPGYRGTVHFTSSDRAASLPSDYTFTGNDGGVHTWFSGTTLRTAGPQTLTVTDAADGTITGSFTVVVVPDAANTLAISDFPSSLASNQPSTLTVTARDRFGNTATGYRGTVHATSSDAAASLPGDYTFNGGDGGSHTFVNGLTLRTTGLQFLTVTDTINGTITAPPSPITVTPEVASTLSIEFHTPFPLVGEPNTITVTARDRFGNLATGYRGTVRFTSPDGAATLPGDYTFSGADGGRHSWPGGIILRTAGPQTINVADTGNPLLAASYLPLAFAGEAEYFFFRDIPLPLTAGVPSDLTAIALDRYGNLATGYRGTIRFTSSDPAALLPADYLFREYDGGIHTWHNGLTVFTAGEPTLAATDTGTTSISRSVSLTVNPAAASTLVVDAPAEVPAGVPFDVTVLVLDPYGNLAASYTGMVTFTSSDVAALLPDAYTFRPDEGGAHTFSGVTLFTAGDQALAVTDPDSALGDSLSITVDPGPMAPGRKRLGSGEGSRPADSDNLSAAAVAAARSGRQPAPAEPTAGAPPAEAVPKPYATAVDRLFAALHTDEDWWAIRARLRSRAAKVAQSGWERGTWPFLRPESADSEA
jgi:hypothetical protein